MWCSSSDAPAHCSCCVVYEGLGAVQPSKQQVAVQICQNSQREERLWGDRFVATRSEDFLCCEFPHWLKQAHPSPCHAPRQNDVLPVCLQFLCPGLMSAYTEAVHSDTCHSLISLQIMNCTEVQHWHSFLHLSLLSWCIWSTLLTFCSSESVHQCSITSSCTWAQTRYGSSVSFQIKLFFHIYFPFTLFNTCYVWRLTQKCDFFLWDTGVAVDPVQLGRIHPLKYRHVKYCIYKLCVVQIAATGQTLSSLKRKNTRGTQCTVFQWQILDIILR